MATKKHLWKASEGELAELDGRWEPCQGDQPRDGVFFFAQQFAVDEAQWANKGKGMFMSADGDYSTRAISFRPGDYPAGRIYLRLSPRLGHHMAQVDPRLGRRVHCG